MKFIAVPSFLCEFELVTYTTHCSLMSYICKSIVVFSDSILVPCMVYYHLVARTCLCSCVLFLCVSEVEVVIPFLYISLWLVCYTQ